jgi:23S rRNA (uracil1939-C5)-methyltransferase
LARSSHPRRKPETPARRVRARIEEIGAGGDGVARVDGGRVFVPLTAPGDLVEADIRGERGVIVDIIEQGRDRADPPCPHYGACGGCSLQHVSRDFYRAWKRQRVVDALAREGLAEAPVADLIETPAASRRRATFAVRKLRDRTLFGFNARRSSMIEDVDDCLILQPDLARRLPALRALAAKMDGGEFDLAATLCDNGLDVAVAGKAQEPQGAALSALIAAMRAAGVVRLSLNGNVVALLAPPVVNPGGVPMTPPTGGFLQASGEGEAALADLVASGVSGAKKIVDLFSGCGTFALPLAREATVLAVDGERASIDALLKAAAAAQGAGVRINPVKAETRDLFERPMTAKELNGFDAVVFDPPRAGAKAQAGEIAASRVPVVVGVSCNPATFARDAAILKAGGYALTRTTPVDQFVYSPHVELVGLFRRK